MSNEKAGPNDEPMRGYLDTCIRMGELFDEGDYTIKEACEDCRNMLHHNAAIGTPSSRRMLGTLERVYSVLEDWVALVHQLKHGKDTEETQADDEGWAARHDACAEEAQADDEKEGYVD